MADPRQAERGHAGLSWSEGLSPDPAPVVLTHRCDFVCGRGARSPCVCPAFAGSTCSRNRPRDDILIRGLWETLAGRGFLMGAAREDIARRQASRPPGGGASDARVLAAVRRRPVKLNYALTAQNPAGIGPSTTPRGLPAGFLSKHETSSAGLVVAGAAGRPLEVSSPRWEAAPPTHRLLESPRTARDFVGQK